MGNKKFQRWSEDRRKRFTRKGPDTSRGGGRERNIRHKKGEEHSRVPKKK